MHLSHSFLKCDNTIFCTQCGGTSSGNFVPWMDTPCVPNVGNRKELMPNTFHVINRRLARGRCPYLDKWKSGLHKGIIWPPIEVHLVEGDDRCHTKCTCNLCRDTADNPHTDSSSFLLSQQELDGLNAGDWTELAALYNVHVPLSVNQPLGPLAATAVDHADAATIMQRYLAITYHTASHMASPQLQNPESDSFAL